MNIPAIGKVVRKALKRLESFNAPVSGVLLNQLDMDAPYYKNHYGEYEYYAADSTTMARAADSP